VLLNNLINTSNGRTIHISVNQGHIESVGEKIPARDHFVLHFRKAVAIPGLINSHDHLDFNCFQPLGTNTYNNYTEWGKEIHHIFRNHIQAVLNIPQNLRTAWGLYKNLISGVTTVVHHGPFIPIENPPIHVFQDTQNLHSTAFEKNWKWKLNNPFLKRRMVVIHAGEGTDLRSKNEIDDLIKYNLSGRNIVGIHGVAMKSSQAKKLKALIWCPESNQLLLDKQPDIKELKKNIRIVLGTDSTLTGNWDFWHHLRFARSLQITGSEELFDMCTRIPAALWGMNRGEIKPGKEADIVILKSKPYAEIGELVFQSGPEDILLVIQQGKIRLFDDCLLPQLRNRIALDGYSKMTIRNSVKFVEGDLPALADKIKSFHPHMVFPVHFREKIMEVR